MSGVRPSAKITGGGGIREAISARSPQPGLGSSRPAGIPTTCYSSSGTLAVNTTICPVRVHLIVRSPSSGRSRSSPRNPCHVAR